jgi:hypothetical protein
MAIEYSFSERMAMSQGVTTGPNVESILLAAIPGAVAVHPAHESNDRRGTDFWVEHERGDHLSVDVKARSEDWAAKPEPQRADDLALETWSVVESGKVGWTRDPSKRSDYVLWLWQDTGRWCLLPFPMLLAVFQEKWRAWGEQYGTHRQHTPQYGGYHSECVFVPRETVWEEIYRRYGGGRN